MQNLDSLTLKFFFEENKNFFIGGVIQKIQMPSRKEVIFYIRNLGENRKLYINIDPKYPHICFIEDKNDYLLKIPNKPPMFCMQLRKYLEGAKIINAQIVPYERIIEFHFNVYDEFGILNSSILAVELMGKYSNIILYNKKTGLIIGSCHNVSPDKSSIREIYGGIKYIMPPKQNKLDILKTSYSTFLENKSDINKNFYYFTKPFAEFLTNKAKSDVELFELLQNAVFSPNLIKEFWGNKEENFNSIIYNYYSKIVTKDIIENKKLELTKILNSKIKKENKILEEKINDEKFERYKKTGDLILQYIYLIKEGSSKIVLENLEIELDPKLKPSENAQKYYKLYSKLKSAKMIYEKRKEDAKNNKEYIENILFSVQNADNIVELNEIEDEIDEFILLKPKKEKKKEKIQVQLIEYKGYKMLLGKNNKQNDYIIRKLSSPEDIWLHAYNSPSSHLIIKQDEKEITNEILLYAAKIVKENSPMKNSSKASVIYTRRKFLKRPPNTPNGYVTYREEKEIVI